MSPAVVLGLLVSTVPVQAAAPLLLLAPNVGPPTSTVKAIGSGYPPADSVNISFDSTLVAVATTSATGAFSTPFKVPATALPGLHQVSAFDNAGIGTTALFVVRTDWAESRFDPSGGGFNQYENVLSTANVGSLVQMSAPQWGAFLHSAPIYIQGNLIAGSSDGTVRAFNPLNGNQIWSFTTGGPIDGSPVAVTRRQGAKPCAVVAASTDGGIYALNGGSGRLLWSFSTGAAITGSPISFGELVAKIEYERLVTVNGDGKVSELDACAGTPIWSDITGNSPVPNATPAVASGVVLPDGTTHTIIVVCFGGSVVALDAGTGAQLWADTGIVPLSSPTVYGSGTGARILIGEDPTAVELNASTGKVVWSTSIDGGITGGIALYRTLIPGTTRFQVQAVIAGDSNGNLYSFNPKTGIINWKNPGPIGSPQALSSVAIANGVAYVMRSPGPTGSGLDGTLLAIDAGSGTQLFSTDEADLNPQPLPPAPASVADGMVFTGDFSGGLRVYGLPG
jgi:outer membrane protein assembly factor BamB